MIDYLQAWFGYSLTGRTDEQVMLFIYGPGGNGKSVLLDTLKWVMGGYAVTPAADLFLTKRNTPHPEAQAILAGARMISVSEVPASAAWDEVLLKAVVAGDRLRARFMRQASFEFNVEGKLTISGNHKPVFPGGMDPAIKRRFKLLELTFVPAVVDLGLLPRLKVEAGGILRWLIDGCLRWQTMGLPACAAISKATDAFVAGQDLLGQWVAERLEAVPGAKVTATDAFHDWLSWRNGQGNGTLHTSVQSFAEAMKAKGLVTKKTMGPREYFGYRLRSAPF